MKDALTHDRQGLWVIVVVTLAALALGLVFEVALGQTERVPYTRGQSITAYATEMDALIAVGYIIGIAVSFNVMYFVLTLLELRGRYAFPVLLTCLGAYLGVVAGRIILYITEGYSLSILGAYLSRIWPQVALIAVPDASAVALAALVGIFLASAREQNSTTAS